MCFSQSSLLKNRLSPKQFKLSYWDHKETSRYLDGGRGESLKVNIEENAYVLKNYLRGGMLAKLLYNQYLWLGCSKTRPHLEKNILTYAINQGLPVPKFAAYYVKKKGLFYQATIITQYLDNIGTLASYLDENELSHEQWLALAELVKRFHHAKINHVDLNADNILIHLNKNELSFSIIDFDKAKIESHNKQWPLDNIKRLQRSLLKIQPTYFSNDAQRLFIKAFGIE